jgi:hypothetical protein
VRHPLRAFNSALAPVVPVYVLTMVIVVTATGVGIEIFDAAGMRSSLFNQIEIVAVIGMVDVISITKIAIERRKRSAWRAVFLCPGKTRNVPREERTRAFAWDPISGLHQGQRPKWLHSKAGYMTAPERFAETSDSSCTAGAVHTWHL